MKEEKRNLRMSRQKGPYGLDALSAVIGKGMNWLQHAPWSRRRNKPVPLKEVVRVIESKFDEKWYVARYPEVMSSAISPAWHYVLQGADAGYDPAPDFSTLRYLERYPDVRHSTLNPYFHWISIGCKEGRHGGAGAEADMPGCVPASIQRQAQAMFTIGICCVSCSEEQVRASIESLARQSYRNFEIILLGQDCWKDSGDPHQPYRGLFCEPDLGKPDLISPSGAIQVRGDYLILIEAGDQFLADGLSILAHAVEIGNADERAQALIFDYLMGERRVRRCLPGFDPDLLSHCDYILSACAVSRTLLGQSAGREVSADFRHLLLSAAEGGAIIRHVPEAILHVSRVSAIPGFHLAARPTAHGLSIIIPNRNRPELLRLCTGFLRQLEMPFELLIVDNRSDDLEIEDVYHSLHKDYGARILRANHAFNYSRMLNLAVQEARFEFLLFLNNDVIIEQPSAITAAVNYAARRDVGVVGSLLRYPDGTVQHAGMVFWQDPDGLPRSEHVLRHSTDQELSALGALSAPRNWQAVTGALQVVRKSVYEAVGGYDDCNLPVEYNDVDFCFRVRMKGLRVVCLPLPGITHDESSSRKSIDVAETRAMRRMAEEVIRARWPSHFACDPFFHPELKLAMGVKSVNEQLARTSKLAADLTRTLKSARSWRKSRPPTTPALTSGLATEAGAWRPRRLSNGLCIVGFLNSEIGLGEAARNLGLASDVARVPTSYVNRPLSSRRNDPRFETFFQPRPDRLATISVDDFTLEGYGFKDTGQGRIQILYPFWELPHLPRGANTMLDRYDELWAASEFIASALRESSCKPVRLMPQPLPVPEVLKSTETPKTRLRFLTCFDYDSCLARKNPLATIAAFRAAFPRRNDVELVVKARGLDQSDARQKVSEAAGRDGRIRIIDATVSREALSRLIDECHVFVSLHRSEGFGFGAAEALAAGKAVIATGWSATSDFVTMETGFPVDYRLRTVEKDEYAHAEGQVWAEPSIEAAVAQFHAVVDDLDAAFVRARRGHALLLQRNSLAAVGARIAHALRELKAV